MKFLDLFAGIGGFRQGMENQGNKCVGYVEIDKWARQSYQAIYNTEGEWTANDITKVTDKDWQQFKGKVECICAGFPCTPAGAKVLTSTGYKNIEDVQVGDYVLTHKNRYQKVLKTMSKIAQGYNDIKAMGVYDLKLTDNHPLYVYNVKESKFEWVEAKNLNPQVHRLTININSKSNSTGFSEQELWLLGRYVSDGYLDKNKKRITYAIRKSKLPLFISKCKKYKFFITHKDRGANEITISDKALYNILLSFNTGAENKNIPSFIKDAPKEEVRIFLEGYLSGDGFHNNIRTMWTTVSENLALGLEQLFIKAYGKLPAIYVRHDTRKNTFRDTYNSQVHNSSRDSKIINQYMTTKIKSIKHVTKNTKVYNLEVKNDNSYTIRNVIVHNCQSFSVAGKQLGFADKTRGTLFFQVARAAEQIKPRYLFLENVKGLLSHDHGNTIKVIIDTLNELGYYVNIELLNSKKFGVPQNRERVYLLCIKSDEITKDGLIKSLNTSKKIVESYLFGILQKNLKEVKKLQEHKSKEWVLNYLVLKDMCGAIKKKSLSRTTLTMTENLLKSCFHPEDGQKYMQRLGDLEENTFPTQEKQQMGMGTSSLESMESMKQNIEELLKEVLVENLSVVKLSTTLISTRKIMTSETCISLKIRANILNAMEVLQKCYPSYWQQELLNLTLVQENTKYANINDYIFTEKQRLSSWLGGTSFKSLIIKRSDLIGHLRGESTREVFFESGESKQLVEENEIVDLLSPTLNTMTGGKRKPNIVVEAEPIRAVNSPEVSNKTQNGRRIKDVGDPEFALTVRDRHGIVIGKGKSLRIRKLTPLECWRLQGFPDYAFYKAKESGVSDSQLYKQAGNSVTVPVIEFVAKRLGNDNSHLW